MNLTQTQVYLLIYVVLVALAGAGEYLHIAPADTFIGMLLFAAGHVSGVFIPSPNGTNAKTTAQSS